MALGTDRGAEHSPPGERERLALELEQWMSRKGPSKLPNELAPLAKLKASGVVLSYSDYLILPAVLRDDIIMWGQAEANLKDEQASG